MNRNHCKVAWSRSSSGEFHSFNQDLPCRRSAVAWWIPLDGSGLMGRAGCKPDPIWEWWRYLV